MTTFPKPITTRLAHTIKGAVNTVAVHTQQIVNLQTKMNAVFPGEWTALTLESGWANLGGFIPAQIHIITYSVAQIVGHITGGSTADGTVITTLPAGYYNTTHAHTFTCNAVTGAQAAPQTGAVNSRAVDLLTVTSPGLIPVNYHAFTVSSNQIEIHGGDLGSNNTGDGATVFAAQNLTNGDTTTAVNLNTPTMTLSTSGVLTISNVNANVAAISFLASLPLTTNDFLPS